MGSFPIVHGSARHHRHRPQPRRQLTAQLGDRLWDAPQAKREARVQDAAVAAEASRSEEFQVRPRPLQVARTTSIHSAVRSPACGRPRPTYTTARSSRSTISLPPAPATGKTFLTGSREYLPQKVGSTTVAFKAASSHRHRKKTATTTAVDLRHHRSAKSSARSLECLKSCWTKIWRGNAKRPAIASPPHQTDVACVVAPVPRRSRLNH